MKAALIVAMALGLLFPVSALAAEGYPEDETLVYSGLQTLTALPNPDGDQLLLCDVCGQDPTRVLHMSIGVRASSLNPNGWILGLNQTTFDFATGTTVKNGSGPSLQFDSVMMEDHDPRTDLGSGDGCDGDLQWYHVDDPYHGLPPGGKYELNLTGGHLDCWEISMSYQPVNTGGYTRCPNGVGEGLQNNHADCATALKVSKASARKQKRMGYSCSILQDTDGERWHTCKKKVKRTTRRVRYEK